MSLTGRLPYGFVRALSQVSGRPNLELQWWLGQDPRRICRRLILENWQLWDGEDDENTEGTAAFEPTGATALAVWTVIQYRGPVRFGGRLWSSHRQDTEARLLDAAAGPEARLRVHGTVDKGRGLRVRVERI